MPDLGLKSFDKLYPMMIRKYQDLIVDQNASEADKINSIILKLNALGKLSNDVVRDWNTVYNWAMNDGLTTDVSNKLEAMKANGEFDNLVSAVVALLGDITILNTTAKNTAVDAINEVNTLAKGNQTKLGDLTTLHTTAKDTTTNAINEIDDLAKSNQTKLGDLTTLQTADKDTIVHAINDNVVSLGQKVDKNDQKTFDILTTPVSYYSTLEIPQGKIMQGFYFAQSGKYLFANWSDGGSPEGYILYRMTPTGKVLDSMTLTGFGHGTLLGIEDVGTDTYIWSNMAYVNGGTTTNSLIRYKYVAGTTLTADPASPSYDHYSNFGSGEEVQVSINGNYIIFCRNLGSGNSWKIEKRNLADVKTGTNTIINSFNVPTSLLYMQGFSADDNDFYWLTGDTNGATYSLLLTKFDLTTGTQVSQIPLNFGEATNGLTEGNYKEPEGTFLYTDTNGAKSLFVGVVTGDSRTRYNKVFSFHSQLNNQKFQGLKNQDIPIDNSPTWNNFTLLNSATVAWSYTPQYRKIGNTVKYRGSVGFTSGTTSIVPANVPFEYRPKKMQRRMVACDGSNTPARISIDNGTGDITIAGIPSGVTACWIDLEYSLDD